MDKANSCNTSVHTRSSHHQPRMCVCVKEMHEGNSVCLVAPKGNVDGHS